MNKSEIAIDYFKNGFNCAQAVLASHAADFRLNEADLLKVACGLGAGMGRLQKTCGAVTGAYLVIGLKHGKCVREDDAAKETTYALVREFDREFTETFGTTDCKELLGCDLLTEEGKTYFRQTNAAEKICTGCVEESVKILERLLK
jgi:C_GCAxxG_C_C family probable redox protein